MTLNIRKSNKIFYVYVNSYVTMYAVKIEGLSIVCVDSKSGCNLVQRLLSQEVVKF